MEKFQEYRGKATRHIQVADHMLVITYPLVNDPKLLMTIMNNVLNSMLCAMSCLLHYERVFKRVNIFGDSIEEQLSLFNHISQKYKLNPTYIRTIHDLREIMREHKNSPMEFARKDKFIIYTRNQDLKTINQASIKKYIGTAKQFVSVVNELTGKNERIFG